jgi:type II restriction/modification system DNA methylase subunit YeeA
MISLAKTTDEPYLIKRGSLESFGLPKLQIYKMLFCNSKIVVNDCKTLSQFELL